MTAKPTTYTSEEAYALMLSGAIIQIQKLQNTVCTQAAVWVNGHRYPISDPGDIYVWLGMDLAKKLVVRLPGTRDKTDANRWQHVAHAPKKAEQARLI